MPCGRWSDLDLRRRVVASKSWLHWHRAKWRLGRARRETREQCVPRQSHGDERTLLIELGFEP